VDWLTWVRVCTTSLYDACPGADAGELDAEELGEDDGKACEARRGNRVWGLRLESATKHPQVAFGSFDFLFWLVAEQQQQHPVADAS
jgi:hypothetical protein